MIWSCFAFCSVKNFPFISVEAHWHWRISRSELSFAKPCSITLAHCSQAAATVRSDNLFPFVFTWHHVLLGQVWVNFIRQNIMLCVSFYIRGHTALKDFKRSIENKWGPAHYQCGHTVTHTWGDWDFGSSRDPLWSRGGGHTWPDKMGIEMKVIQ